VTEGSKLSSIVFDAMPSTYVAAKQSYLTKEDANEINKFAWFTKKHNDLLKLSPGDAVNQFTRLDPAIQTALSELFDTDYGAGKEQNSTFLNTIKNAVTRPVGALFEGLRDYTETVISNPFRQVDAAVRQTGDSWDETYNGEAYFDSERSAKVENFYGSTVSKISKMLAAGKRPGEILLELNTEEEFDAFERMMEGDEEFDRAVKEFDDAKVSFGRRMFNWLQPGAGTHGVQRWIYDRASGAGDLTYQIFADPLTYATLGVGTGVRLFGKTVIEGTRSLKALLEAPDDASKLEKIFRSRGVNEYWDKVGTLINDLDSKDKVARIAAANKFKEDFPELSDEFREILRQGKVKSAEDAKQFFTEADNVHNLMKGMGVVKLEKALMPTWKTTRNIKSKLRSATLAVIRGDNDELAAIGTIDNIVANADRLARLESQDYELLQGGADLVKETKKRRGVMGKIERLATRFPIAPAVNIMPSLVNLYFRWLVLTYLVGMLMAYVTNLKRLTLTIVFLCLRAFTFKWRRVLV
jgi:hypothetical protein